MCATTMGSGSLAYTLTMCWVARFKIFKFKRTNIDLQYLFYVNRHIKIIDIPQKVATLSAVIVCRRKEAAAFCIEVFCEIP